jgi:hypothetical protein
MTSQTHLMDHNTRLRLGFEEWIKNEFEILAKQHEDPEIARNTRFIAVDALILRNEKNIGVISYEFLEDNIWIILSQPILRKLDNHSLSHFLKIILETLVELKKENKKTIREAEIIAYRKMIRELEHQGQVNKNVNQIERMKQAIFFLSTQFLKGGLPVVNPKTLIPVKSDNKLHDKIMRAYQNIRIKLYTSIDPSQFDKIKFRILPYYFKVVVQDLNKNESELRIKPIISFDVYDYQKSYSFSLFIINTFFLETIDLTDLEILLAYELVSLINSRKFSRGEMEKEIYDILSKDREVDENFEVLKGFYDRKLIEQTRIKINEMITNDLESEETPLLRIE